MAHFLYQSSSLGQYLQSNTNNWTDIAKRNVAIRYQKMRAALHAPLVSSGVKLISPATMVWVECKGVWAAIALRKPDFEFYCTWDCKIHHNAESPPVSHADVQNQVNGLTRWLHKNQHDLLLADAPVY
jgi:hypothetical protein